MDIVFWFTIALILLAGLYGALCVLGALRWNNATRSLEAQLDAARVTSGNSRYDAQEIVDLPLPVRRYFELALTEGQPIVRTADIALEGMFNMSIETPRWKVFRSGQHVVTNRPGFVWNARIALFPGLTIHVHDAYVGGEGVLRPSVLGLFSVGSVQGTGDIARGELMRWLAEAVWYPTALLPSQGIEWQAVDATSAKATLTDGGIRLDMLFRFGSDGPVTGIRVDARGATVDGETVMMPWEGTFRDYRRQDGMLIPFYGEVAWITPQGAKPYFRGSVKHVAFHFDP